MTAGERNFWLLVVLTGVVLGIVARLVTDLVV